VTILTAATRLSGLWRPRASARGTVGVEVGRTWLSVARRRRGAQDWALDGIPLDPEDLDGSTAASRRLRDRARSAGLPRGDAVCALCSPSVSIFPLALPAARPERLDLLVAAHAEKHLSRPLEEMILDYSILPETIRRPGEEATAALVFAAPRATVQGAMSALESIGLGVARLLTPACVHARRTGASTGDRRLVISTGEDATSISVVENGHVLLERILGWGRATLLRRIESELQLAPEHARTLLDHDGSANRMAADSDSPGSALREVLAPVFRELTGETAGCLAYCSSVFRHAPIHGAVVVGALAAHEPLAEALEHELGVGLERPASPAGRVLARFATPIGCASWTREAKP
jgi:Tfp pilus assembly PilM family ATPase